MFRARDYLKKGCCFDPNSREKMAVFRARFKAGLPLKHPDDTFPANVTKVASRNDNFSYRGYTPKVYRNTLFYEGFDDYDFC